MKFFGAGYSQVAVLCLSCLLVSSAEAYDSWKRLQHGLFWTRNAQLRATAGHASAAPFPSSPIQVRPRFAPLDGVTPPTELEGPEGPAAARSDGRSEPSSKGTEEQAEAGVAKEGATQEEDHHAEGSEAAKTEEGGAEEGATASEREEAHPDTKAYAICLMMTVVMVMSVFYLVNWHDEGVRTTTWATLSMTVSIFGAVLLYSTLKDFLFEVVFGVETIFGEVAVLLALFIVLMAILQWILLAVESMDKLYGKALSVIWSHIAGFAAMYCGAGLQSLPMISTSSIALLALFIVMSLALVSLVFAAIMVRRKVAQMDGKVDEVEEAWMDDARDVDTDVVSLCLGFSLMQLGRFFITGKIQPYEPAEPPPETITQWQALALLGTAILMGAFNLAMGRIMSWLRTSSGEQKVMSETQLQLLNMIQNTMATAMAWSLLFWGEWQIYVSGFAGSRIEGCLRTAVFLTVLALLTVIAFDFIIDLVLHDRTDKRSLRSMLLSMGLMVGFTWERCFDLGLEHLSFVHGGSSYLYTILKHCTPLVMAGIVLPAWTWYILPKAWLPSE